MARTFKALADQADFNALPADGAEGAETAAATREEEVRPPAEGAGGAVLTLRHDIHIHLPESTEIAVYDAIFRSIRNNLQA